MKSTSKSFFASAGIVLSLATTHIRADQNSQATEASEPPIVITKVETPDTFDKDAARDSLMANMEKRNAQMQPGEDDDKKKPKSEDGEGWKMNLPSMPSGDIRLEVIMNLAKQAWNVFIENRGKVDYKYSYANAVPKGITSSSDLMGFSDVVFQSYNIRQADWMGMTKFDLTFTLVFQHGGSFNGRGRYLETISLIPTAIYAGWCEKVNAEVSHVSTSNVGTKENPVASATLELNLSSHCSVGIGAIKKAILFQVRGDTAAVRHSIISRN